MKSKKILFIYYRLFKAGGLTKVLVNLCNELVNSGYDVTILIMLNDKSTFYYLDKRVKIEIVDSFSTYEFQKINVNINKYLPKFSYKNEVKNYIYDLGQWRVLYNWLKNNHKNYDVIISSYYKLSAQLSVNKKVNHKTIAWEHNSFKGVNKFWQFFPKTFYKDIKGVVTLTNEGKNYYSLFNHNVHKIYNIAGEPYESNVIKFDLKENDITYVGRLSKEKNVDHILEIFSKSKISNTFKLNIVGDGELVDVLKEKASLLRIENRVVFHGMLNPTEVNKILCKSKIVMLCSSTEGLPNVLIEGMMTGNILVSYDCKYGPSEIINKSNGFLVDIYDKDAMIEVLNQLFENQELMNGLCNSSYQDSKKWRKEKILDKWITILK
ncbi:glycosyltransferase [Empedobacter falsenii]